MTTKVGQASEWTARALRPVAQWVVEPGPDGSDRLVMRWSVPEPTVAGVSVLQSATA